jgi:hypothetical protein
MTQAAQAVAPYITVDSELTWMDAANLAWTMRGLGTRSVDEIEVPVYDDTIEGAAVLRPSTPVDEIVAEFLTSAAASRESVVLGLTG